MSKRRPFVGVVMSNHGCLWNPRSGEINCPADAEFIAAAPELVRELAAAVERVEKLAEEWDAVAKWRYGPLCPRGRFARELRDALEGK